MSVVITELILIGLLLAAFLGIIALLFAIVKRIGLHRRHQRHRQRVSGKRRSAIPYSWLGWGTIAMSVAGFIGVVAWSISEHSFVPARFLALLMLASLGQYWRVLGRRIRMAPAALPKLERSVVYARAFRDENRPFVNGPASRLERYTDKMVWRVFKGPKRNPVIQLTLEDFLKTAISQQIGPFVALGSPIDKLPPAGALREYAPDSTWRERFLELARAASCIIVDFGESGNLDWELEHIRQEGMNRKLCVFTRVRPYLKDEFTERAFQSEAVSRNGLNSAWAATVEVLGGAGFQCQPECPGFGAAVGFDDAGKSVLLTTGAGTPNDYVRPVADWITTGARSGKWMPAKCGSCENTVYYFPNSSPQTSAELCFTCARKARLAAMSGFERTIELHPVVQWLVGSLCLIVALLLTAFLGVAGLVIFGVLVCIPWIARAGWRRVKRSRLQLTQSTVESADQISTALTSTGTAVSEISNPGTHDQP